MSRKPKVTIGLCVKDAEQIIKDVIDSILRQEFPKELIELIVVVGDSKDRTLSIVKSILHKTNIKNKILCENKGLGFARQTIVNNACGDYIIWVDADMMLPSDYVKEQVNFMEENPDVGIAGGKYMLFQTGNVVADLENIVYVVDSIYGEKEVSKYGYLPGTEGAIYRVESIKQVGGFDKNMKGATEDLDVAYRIRAANWRVCVTKNVFRESCRETWKELWDQYFWYGFGAHFALHKDPSIIAFYKMTPLAGFAAGALRIPGASKLIHKKFVILLPIHYGFKRIAWSLGFLKAHIEGYGHKSRAHNKISRSIGRTSSQI